MIIKVTQQHRGGPAGSGRSSREGFPEAGGEGCQPQGQEETMPLEGRSGRPALGWPRTPAGSKAACGRSQPCGRGGRTPRRPSCARSRCHTASATQTALPGPGQNHPLPEARAGAGPRPVTPPGTDRATKCKPATRALPSIILSIRVFSNESVLPIRWPKYPLFTQLGS